MEPKVLEAERAGVAAPPAGNRDAHEMINNRLSYRGFAVLGTRRANAWCGLAFIPACGSDRMADNRKPGPG